MLQTTAQLCLLVVIRGEDACASLYYVSGDMRMTSFGGTAMPRIDFRGKTYNSEFEMPMDVREAYRRERERHPDKHQAAGKSLPDLVDMAPEVKAIYERAIGNIDEKLPSSRKVKDLPRTEDLYRRSAPENMQNLPSDESIYQPSPPAIGEMKPAIEPEPALGLGRFVSSLIWAIILIAVAYFIIQFVL